MSSDNPYASPLTSGGGAENAFDTAIDQMVPATRGRRFVNFVIDQVVGRVVVVIIFIVMSLAFDLADWFANMSTGMDFLLSTSLFLSFYFVQEAFFGRTIGKLITGTVVVNATGGRPTVPQVLGRTLARIIPFEPFSALGTPPTPWHDSLSKTRVVRISR